MSIVLTLWLRTLARSPSWPSAFLVGGTSGWLVRLESFAGATATGIRPSADAGDAVGEGAAFDAEVSTLAGTFEAAALARIPSLLIAPLDGQLIIAHVIRRIISTPNNGTVRCGAISFPRGKRSAGKSWLRTSRPRRDDLGLSSAIQLRTEIDRSFLS